MIVCSAADAGDRARRRSVPFDTYAFSESRAFADDGRFPYGASKRGKYGERRNVVTEDEAQTIVREYFTNRDLKIGKLKKKKFYFETDITDKQGRVIDRIIIDKRTGRIRSVY
jgi:hypothetical protein